ncbi:hypothetical protein PM082_022416 [Marasmius tenuissimus]|nr:hypothetical protein PM082_022416 [Marasmius tenuissimus]
MKCSTCTSALASVLYLFKRRQDEPLTKCNTRLQMFMLVSVSAIPKRIKPVVVALPATSLLERRKEYLLKA